MVISKEADSNLFVTIYGYGINYWISFILQFKNYSYHVTSTHATIYIYAIFFTGPPFLNPFLLNFYSFSEELKIYF